MRSEMALFRRDRAFSSNAFPCDRDDAILLVTKSMELIQKLNGITNNIVQSVEDLPMHCQLKSVMLDAEYAKLGNE